MTLEEKITAAEATQDLETLREIQKTLLAHAVENQQAGEMAPRLLVGNAPGMLDALGVEPDFTVQEGLGLDLLNRVSHAGRWVEFVRDKARRPELPVIVGEGDSWFLHQQLQDVLDHLRESRFNVRSLAAAGDTVANMLSTDDWFEVLAKEGAHAFLFSGGGNDFLGNGRVDSLVKSEKSGAAPRDLVHPERVDALLEEIAGLYRGMLRRLARDIPWVRVFSHGYDYVAKVEAGPWIWPYLQAKGYTAKRAVDVVKVLLDRFNERLLTLAAEERNFTFLDMRGVVGASPNSWHDSIHPKGAGYAKVAGIFAEKIEEFLKRGDSRMESTASTEAIFGGLAHSIAGSASRQAANAMGLAPSAGMHHLVADTYRETAHSLASAQLTDFERVRALARMLPPENSWNPQLDEQTRKHIRDVRNLLLASTEGEDPARLRARLEMMPTTLDSAQPEALAGLGTRMLDFAAAADHLAAQVTEALFGEGELEPVQILLLGYRAGRAVGRVQIMDRFGSHRGSGSGFLVAPGLFLTNCHVLKDAETAAASRVVFNDEIGLDGSFPRPRSFRVTREVFCASPASDFAFVSLATVGEDGTALSEFGWLPLIEESGKATMYEPVSIIQHPGGRPKQIAVRNSFVMGRAGDGIYYTTDTLAGSSGSPLLNRQWQVVGLHHRFVPHPTDPRGVLANRGVRISSVFAELKRLAASGHGHAAKVLVTLGGAGTIESAPLVFDPPAVKPEVAAEIIVGGPYDQLTEAEFLAAIGRQDDLPQDSDLPLPDVFVAEESFTEALPADRESVLRRIGPEGYRLIVEFEVSSKAWYEKKLHRPIKPGAASGITIGIGYDLGYHTAAEFARDWSSLSETARSRLGACIGKTRSAAAALLPGLGDITIPYQTAVSVFERATLPKYFIALNRHIPDAVLESLPPRCVAVLVSLTFNRGASFQSAGERYREMRAIRDALISGRTEEVPSLIRAMKRIWQGDPSVRGLLRRRDREADLFEAGLGGGLSSGGEFIPKGIVVREELSERGDNEADPCALPDLDEESEIRLPVPVFTESQITRIGPESVRWVLDHANNPDYVHLPATAAGQTFDLTPDLIESAIHLGFYRPVVSHAGCIIVAIRGVAIANGQQKVEDAASIRLREQKPDHRTFRCLLCVYQKHPAKLSVYLGSTVPNRGGVASCANLLNGFGGTLANLLPTGCYEYCVGTHRGSAEVPTVLRLGDGPEPAYASRVTTLRTANDGIYGTRDLWDLCKPADNVHPAFNASSAEFSSLGCLTVKGSYSTAMGHTGLWADFRRKGGFDGDQHRGRRYDVVLTTGMELAAIAMGGGGLRRLSHGSSGDEVRALQAALGIASPDGDFGPATKKRLVELELAARAGIATGIYSMNTQQALGFQVF
jgi:V8-like Glu-specific endopeptidase/GH24 family phage-related lysozyme (muramidase)